MKAFFCRPAVGLLWVERTMHGGVGAVRPGPAETGNLESNVHARLAAEQPY
jgi:hypothetical protein